jgi:hypothetical protein
MPNKYVFPIMLLLVCYRPVIAEQNTPELTLAPAGNKPFLTVHAKGDQIYLCIFDSGAYSWKWQAPDAKLFDVNSQKQVGTHGSGPNWKYQDGSSVKAKMIQKIAAPDVNSVPWLLLETIEHSDQGLLAQTRYIMRTNTQGGIEPSSGCDANHLGAEAKAPYSADYVFFGQ